MLFLFLKQFLLSCHRSLFLLCFSSENGFSHNSFSFWRSCLVQIFQTRRFLKGIFNKSRYVPSWAILRWLIFWMFYVVQVKVACWVTTEIAIHKQRRKQKLLVYPECLKQTWFVSDRKKFYSISKINRTYDSAEGKTSNLARNRQEPLSTNILKSCGTR